MKKILERPYLAVEALDPLPEGFGHIVWRHHRSDPRHPVHGSIRDQLKSGQVPIHANIMRPKVEAVGHYDTYFGEEAFNFLQEAQPKDRLFDISLRCVKVLLPKAAKKAGIKGPPVTAHCLREISRSYATYIEPPSSPR